MAHQVLITQNDTVVSHISFLRTLTIISFYRKVRAWNTLSYCKMKASRKILVSYKINAHWIFLKNCLFVWFWHFVLFAPLYVNVSVSVGVYSRHKMWILTFTFSFENQNFMNGIKLQTSYLHFQGGHKT